MTKLVLLFVATLLVAAQITAAFRTTITTVETVEPIDNPSNHHGGASQGCQRELRRKDLSSCMEFLREQLQPGSYPLETRRQQKSPRYRACCEQLRSFEEERCTCEGLEAEMSRMSQPEMVHKMMHTAEILPRSCGATSSTCHFRTPRWF